MKKKMKIIIFLCILTLLGFASTIPEDVARFIDAPLYNDPAFMTALVNYKAAVINIFPSVCFWEYNGDYATGDPVTNIRGELV